MSKRSLRIQVKKAKNEMIIITAPDGEDYPCKEDEEIAAAIKEIVDDEDQYKVVQSEPIRAEVVEEHTAAPPREDRRSSDDEDDDDDDIITGSLTDNLIAEGLSFLLGKAQESSSASAKSYSRLNKK